jgi:hypothetical protein
VGAQPFVVGQPFMLPTGQIVFAPSVLCPAPLLFGPADLSASVGFGAANPSATDRPRSAVHPGITFFQPGQLLPSSVGMPAPAAKPAGTRAPMMLPPGLDGHGPNLAVPRSGASVQPFRGPVMVPPGVQSFLNRR